MTKKVFCVTGLGFGTEGKGSIVDYLTRESKAELVIRFGGCANSSSNVITPDGKHHCFSHFGSGTLAGASTYILGGTVVDPSAILQESEHLESLGVEKPLSNLAVDSRALVTTPFHKSVCRLKEIVRKHGSTGTGVGEVIEGVVKSRSTLNWNHLYGRSSAIKEILAYIREQKSTEITALRLKYNPSAEVKEEFDKEWDKFCRIDIGSWAEFYRDVALNIGLYSNPAEFKSSKVTIYEGSLGILLDQDFGFKPHYSYGKFTSRVARDTQYVINTSYGYFSKVINIGVVRSYAIRHGAGPLSTETNLNLYEPHNQPNKWQGNVRQGYFDLGLFNYAKKNDEVNYLAVTHLDRYVPDRVAEYIVDVSIKNMKPNFININNKTEFLKVLNVPIGIESYGPTANEKILSAALKKHLTS